LGNTESLIVIFFCATFSPKTDLIKKLSIYLSHHVLEYLRLFFKMCFANCFFNVFKENTLHNDSLDHFLTPVETFVAIE
jgi:hypothetical protein